MEFTLSNGRKEEYTYITSAGNERIKDRAKLYGQKYRNATGTFICEGAKLVAEAADAGLVQELYVTEEFVSDSRFCGILESAEGAQVCVLSDNVFRKLSSDTAYDGVVAVCRKRSSEDLSELVRDSGGNVMVLDSVRDPGNVGTILRSARGLGNIPVILLSCADVYNPKVIRASMGAVFFGRFAETSDVGALEEVLSASDRRVICTVPETGCMELGKTGIRDDDVFIIGNEGHGVSEELKGVFRDRVIIPMTPGCESLNASAACSVILWECFRRKI